MNYIKHTIAAHEYLHARPDAGPLHIALYWALFFAWNATYFEHGIALDHEATMHAARIGNRKTYRTALYDLHAWGLLHYQPSKSKHHPSRCVLTDLSGAKVPPVKPATGDTSAPDKSSLPGADVPQALRAEVPLVKPLPGALLPQDSLLDQTSFQTVETNSAAAPEKKRREVFAGEGHSGVEVLDDTPQPNGAVPAPDPTPKKKVAPKKKGEPTTTRRAAPPTGPHSPRRRPRPEVPFTASPISTPALFAAAFTGTDYALADLSYYFERVSNWRDKHTGQPPHRTDWIATARTFMLNDARDNCLKLAPGTAHVGSPDDGQQNPGSPTAGHRASRWD